MMLDSGHDHRTVASVQAFIAWGITLEVDVTNSAGLNTDLGPHRRAM